MNPGSILLPINTNQYQSKPFYEGCPNIGIHRHSLAPDIRPTKAKALCQARGGAAPKIAPSYPMEADASLQAQKSDPRIAIPPLGLLQQAEIGLLPAFCALVVPFNPVPEGLFSQANWGQK